MNRAEELAKQAQERAQSCRMDAAKKGLQEWAECVQAPGAPVPPALTSARCQTDGPPLPCQGSGPESCAPVAFSPPGRLLGG